MFTFNTFSTRAWSARHFSIQVDDADIRIKSIAFIGAISDNGGLEAYTIHPKAITTVEFIEFVEMLSAKFLGKSLPFSWTTCRCTRPKRSSKLASA